MNELEYTCKICGTKRVAEYDPECPLEHIASWAAMLTCPRCHEFFSEWRKHEACVEEISMLWLIGKRTNSRISDWALQVKSILTRRTQAMAGAAARFYSKSNQWTPDLVDQLMDSPERYPTILRQLHQQTKTAQCDQPATYNPGNRD